MNALESHRGREFRGVEELTRAAATLIERYSPEPARGNVRLGITERTVRHYLSEDLLGEPTGQSGTSLVFNYGNLLRLLAVKKLLAEHWSVIKIKEFMKALDITALEQLVGGALLSEASAASAAQKRAETERSAAERAATVAAAARDDAASAKTTDPARGGAAAAADAPASPPPLASLAVESARRAERASVEWIELAPGLEIKVRRSFRPPRDDEQRVRLAARFWSIINRNTGAKG
ncbi:MAG TPA: MerR family transcriptional regulator [Pyrinomonadaceae bacterium]|jgi:DNA-binding transcriptional MerR regulator|nr:MerR family transcriptional regulator [Pyrinomonadaceae bacterium]